MKKITFLLACFIFCVAGFTSTGQTIGNLWGMTTQYGDSSGGTMFGFDPVTGNDSVIVPFSGPTGSYPYYNNNIIQTSGGTFYGITYGGGTNGYGTIFKRTASGKATVLHNFNKDGIDGYYPYGSIMIAADGMLYGMTCYGGATGYGIIFKCDTLGNYRIIHNFAGGATDGEYPYIGGLTQAANGTLFGMTYDGGTNNEGTIFKCDTAGNVTVIYSFGTNANDGYYPYNSLTIGINGMMYGTTYYGGGSGKYGTVFECDTLGNERVIYAFYTANDGYAYYPYGNITQAPNGTLFGTVCEGGGTDIYGIIFKCDTLGNETNLHGFYSFSTDGYYPYGSMVFGAGDTLYGLVYSGGNEDEGILFKCDTNDGSGYAIAYSFNNYTNDGYYPYGSPIIGNDGNIYGLTYEGGVTGEGTIFKYNTSTATENIVYNFGTNVLGSDGLEDFIQGKDGNLYGMANTGGAYGSGTLLKYNPVTGKTTLLHDFYDTANNGASPKYGRLVQGSNGKLYGVTEYGGANGKGVVFECTTSGIFNVLYSFGNNVNDGYDPVGGLVIEQNGLYGMTPYGGTNNYGIIFKCDTLGNETILYNFGTNSNDGTNPTASLIRSVHGTLYGMTNKGGTNSDGIIFKCDTLGNETVLYSFGTNSNDGLTPFGSLVFGRDSMLYGTTSQGGVIGNGTVFKSDTLGNESVLYNFGTNSNDGSYPVGSLIIGSDSNMYGTTEEGGLNGYGTLFECDTLGNETVMYSYSGGTDGAYPEMDLLEAMSASASLSSATCSGTPVAASVRGAVAPFTYLWSNGSTSRTDTLSKAGTYTVMVTDARGITVTSTVTTTYNVVNATASNTSVCNGLSANLNANGTGGTGSLTYTWMPGSLSGSSPSVSPTLTTTYTVTVTDGSGCKDSAMETVTVNSLPVVTITGKDTINQGSNDTLTATGGVTYAWSDGSTSNPDIVSPSSNQTYTVTVTNSNGCTSTDTMRVVVNITTGINSATAHNSTTAFPNPATSTLNLAFSTTTTDGIIEVCDVTGNVIITKQQTISNGETMQIDVSNLASGLYFVKVTTGKQTQVMRFVKQ